MSNSLPLSITNAIESLSDLPGIGSRSAERLVLSLLKNNSGLDQKIAKSIGELKTNVIECSKCFHYCDKNIENPEISVCPICKNLNREQQILCIVESPVDLIALEKTHEFKGLYHVLHGVISPLNKVLPEDIRINELFNRIKQNSEINEIIFALAGNIESDATANFISENIQPIFKGKITKIARGIPSGGDLDYLDTGTIGRAMLDRRVI